MLCTETACLVLYRPTCVLCHVGCCDHVWWCPAVWSSSHACVTACGVTAPAVCCLSSVFEPAERSASSAVCLTNLVYITVLCLCLSVSLPRTLPGSRSPSCTSASCADPPTRTPSCWPWLSPIPISVYATHFSIRCTHLSIPISVYAVPISVYAAPRSRREAHTASLQVPY